MTSHPILPVEPRREIPFTFDGTPLIAREGEVISSALFACGIRIFGRHPRDDAAQGIFCVNGQCSQCMVLVDGAPVKGCMTVVTPGMRVESCDGVPGLPDVPGGSAFGETRIVRTEVLVIGGGPAGVNAAIELGKLGVRTLLVDDKTELGGKLTLQTHPFFGSRDDCYAGIRGIDIARILTGELGKLDAVEVMTGTIAVGAFVDGRIGMHRGDEYFLVEPEAVLVACGAREKSLAFPGCDLPGVYGAGAFQTLLNRDLVRPTDRLFIVGGGNVGLIAGYHAIQAGIKVVGLVEALPRCGGYKVHLDKLRRLGVPVFTSHTILAAEGTEQLERITIGRIDDRFRPLPGEERSYDVDTLLVAVGLSPVDELYGQCEAFGIPCYKSGDANVIAEASAAIFSGRITGRRIARDLGREVEIPDEWARTEEILRSKPGRVSDLEISRPPQKVYPIIRCVEEIPCNPCVDACAKCSIGLDSDSIMGLPVFEGECTGCMKCVAACPALAINLIRPDWDEEGGRSLLVMPYELDPGDLVAGRVVETVDMEGNPVGEGRIEKFRPSSIDEKRMLVSISAPKGEAPLVAGFLALEAEYGRTGQGRAEPISDDTIVCRCERVTAGEIRREIRDGVRDMNVLKATIRTGMGACGGKTCTELILRLYREEGVDLDDVALPTDRPFVSEVPLSAFAGLDGEETP